MQQPQTHPVAPEELGVGVLAEEQRQRGGAQAPNEQQRNLRGAHKQRKEEQRWQHSVEGLVNAQL